jgi:hypothetical protein
LSAADDPDVAPTIASAASAPDPATLSVKGDAARVQLVSGTGASFSGGALPPGRYAVVVTYTPGSPPVAVSETNVQPGQTVTVTCKSSFMRCSVQ